MSKGELPLIFVQINFHRSEDYELDHYDLYDVIFMPNPRSFLHSARCSRL